MSSQTVLNVPSSSQSSSLSVETVGVNLQRSMLCIKGMYFDAGGRGVDYDRISESNEFLDYCKVADSLSIVDCTICSEEERKAFFINVYNALTIHGLIACNVLPSSVLEVQGFWRNTCYNIGGHVFSLDDIEHGVLRCNQPHPGNHGNATFLANDSRLQFVLSHLDPRIHFALVCGAKSCPAIQVYSAAKLERGLTMATHEFCRQEVKVDISNRKVFLSKIFMWYFKDFAVTAPCLLEWILQYLEGQPQVELKQLLVDSDNIVVEYSDYNWLINKL